MNAAFRVARSVPKSRSIRTALSSLLLCGMALSCRGGFVQGNGLPPPTVDTVPAQSTVQEIVITGTKRRDTAIWLHVSGEAQARQVVPRDEEISWSYSFELAVGDNTFVVFASGPLFAGGDGADTFSSRVGPFEVELISDVPAPGLNDLVTPTNITPQTLSGTKAADTTLWIAIGNAAAVEVSTAPGATTWTFDLPLHEGSNTFSLFARSSTSVVPSPSVGGLIILDTVAPDPPVISPLPTSPTGAITTLLEGTQPSDSLLCLRRGQEPLCVELQSDIGNTAFAESIMLVDGSNFLCLSSKDLAGNQSNEVCVTVEKLPGPSIAFVSPKANDTVSGASIDVVVQVTGGGLPSEAIASVEVCIDGTCTPASSIGGGQYSLTVDTTAFAEGSVHEISVVATNVGGAASTVSINVVYSSGGALVLSDNAAPGHSTDPRMATGPDGVLHVVWSDECIFFGFAACPESQLGNQANDIFYRSFNGTSWSPITLISNDANDGDSRQPAIAIATNGDVHIAWQESGNVSGSGFDFDIAHRRIVAGALQTITIVTNSAKSDQAPSLAAAADGSVHLTWERQELSTDRDIYYNKWVSSTGWGTPVRLSKDTCTGATPENVCTPLAGCRWNGSACVDAKADSRLPNVAVDSSSNAHVVWQEERDVPADDLDVYYRIVTAGTPSAVTRLVSDSFFDGDSALPAVAIDSSNTLHVVWRDTADGAGAGADADIWYRTYSSTQVAGQIKLISDGSDRSSDTPAVVIGGPGKVIIVWAEPDPTPGSPNADISYRVVNGGIPLTIKQPVVNSALSVRPRAVVDLVGALHMVWEDNSPGSATDDNRPAAQGGGPDTDIFYVSTALD
ncbi:MAG: Ig-like domain-containing protein [Myxococcota bacterium]